MVLAAPGPLLTLFEGAPPQYAPAKIKIEHQKSKTDSPLAEMSSKQLRASGCTLTDMRQLGEYGKCAAPKMSKQMMLVVWS